ncbi:hypothetical protein CgunFtcFv8_021240 [Champsocephalus gunnari]|uniref:Uncharacterized protein n=1 Tax=Champsocephalus gunnari TaxID=52237 RepID=A0AAN8EC25_CHAGU|nr:hypothetical protein CgunFtcFv8_021240 [Champsocephalus gunnari]
MERQDDGEDSAEEPGSPSRAREHSGSPQQEVSGGMRRNDNYLPVPGEEKNLDVDLNTTARSNESIVRPTPYCSPGS